MAASPATNLCESSPAEPGPTPAALRVRDVATQVLRGLAHRPPSGNIVIFFVVFVRVRARSSALSLYFEGFFSFFLSTFFLGGLLALVFFEPALLRCRSASTSFRIDFLSNFRAVCCRGAAGRGHDFAEGVVVHFVAGGGGVLSSRPLGVPRRIGVAAAACCVLSAEAPRVPDACRCVFRRIIGTL